MVAKELRSAWWKPLFLAPLVVISVLEIPAYRASERFPDYSSPWPMGETFSAEVAVNQIFSVYTGGAIFSLGILAVLLGSLFVSPEASRGTIFFLLSRPLSRNRILLTKYAVGAGVLLAVAILGHAFVLGFAVLVKGYPLGIFNVWGMALSSVLIWLVSLPVLGLAASFSILSRNPIVSLLATCVAIATAFAIPLGVLFYVSNNYSMQTLEALSSFGERVWSLVVFVSWDLYNGESLEITSFLIWPLFAAVMLAAALWLFRRKSY